MEVFCGGVRKICVIILSMNKTTLLKETIIRQLEGQNLEKIILFGSLASGRFSNSSDIDLLVIQNTKDKPQERYVKLRMLIQLNYPIDLFVLTNVELHERLGKSFFFREIVEKGELIYEKKHRGKQNMA